MVGCKIYEKCGRDCTHCSAQEAKEKQKAVKVQKVLTPFGAGYECGNCGSELYVSEFNGVYCHWCGQKLDWQ